MDEVEFVVGLAGIDECEDKSELGLAGGSFAGYAVLLGLVAG
ncbi:hypothetical protein ACIBL8_48025 [Streptomyces sp. NPDC050523]